MQGELIPLKNRSYRRKPKSQFVRDSARLSEWRDKQNGGFRKSVNNNLTTEERIPQDKLPFLATQGSQPEMQYEVQCFASIPNIIESIAGVTSPVEAAHKGDIIGRQSGAIMEEANPLSAVHMGQGHGIGNSSIVKTVMI